MKKIYAVLIAVLVLAGMVSFLLFFESNNPEVIEQEAIMSLSSAQELIGMECIGSDVSQECIWNDTKYGFLVPGNWENDRALRIEACEQGYINERYNIVTDKKTWYATANFEEENSALVDAFLEVGFDDVVVASFCR